jgi:hypothetical protein
VSNVLIGKFLQNCGFSAIVKPEYKDARFFVGAFQLAEESEEAHL